MSSECSTLFLKRIEQAQQSVAEIYNWNGTKFCSITARVLTSVSGRSACDTRPISATLFHCVFAAVAAICCGGSASVHGGSARARGALQSDTSSHSRPRGR